MHAHTCSRLLPPLVHVGSVFSSISGSDLTDSVRAATGGFLPGRVRLQEWVCPDGGRVTRVRAPRPASPLCFLIPDPADVPPLLPTNDQRFQS